MHKFNTLKYRGGAVTLLPQHVAQRMVRHVSKRNGWNGVSEEVQDNDGRSWYSLFSNRSECGNYRAIPNRPAAIFFRNHLRKKCIGHRNTYGIPHFNHINACCGRIFMFRHACGGRNHLLAEVAA